jgi:hypothetical protein
MFEWAVGDTDHAQSRVRGHRRLVERRLSTSRRSTDVGNRLCDCLAESGFDVDFTIDENSGIVEVNIDDPTSSLSRRRLVEAVKSIVHSAGELGCSVTSTSVIDDVGARVVVSVMDKRRL